MYLLKCTFAQCDGLLLTAKLQMDVGDASIPFGVLI
jgi:hypothetical protein